MRLAYVGLGAMGSEVVKRLLGAGFEVAGWNRTRAKAEPLEALGMGWAGSPREAAAGADVVFSMVTDAAALRAVCDGPDGILAGLSPGKVYVEMSTAGPSVVRALAAEVAERGAVMLDSPVSGSTLTVAQGSASLMVGGDAEVVERVRPALEAIGPKVTHVGETGQAVLMKVAVNLSLAVQMLAFGEGLLIAEKGGIPRATAAEVLLNSVIASPMLKYRGPFALELPEQAWFDVNMMQKDLQLALEQGRRLDVPMPATAATNEMLTAARGLGLAHEDFAVVVQALARMSGLER